MLSALSCQQQIDEDIESDIEDLQDQINNLILTLESNNEVTEVLIQDGQLLLIFEDGTSIFTDLPINPIPNIGDNGNWFVGNVDLGVLAVADIPEIGEDGNWYVDGKNTGVSAEATDGIDGQDGDGVANVTYDQTTGILDIILDSGVTYSFELYLEDVLKAVKLEDLNGEYLISTIYNGDLPFVRFTYDESNQLTDASYFTTLLNEPVEYMTVHRELDASNNITSQTVTEYATKSIAIAENDYPLDDALEGIYYYNLEDAFNLLFPTGIMGFTGTGHDFFIAASSNGYHTFFDDSYIYVFDENNLAVSVNLLHVNTEAEFGYSNLGMVDYIWTPEYDNDQREWESEYLPVTSGVNVNGVSINVTTGALDIPTLEYYEYYPYALVAYPYTGSTDEITDNYISDYIGTTDDNVEVFGSPNEEFKAFFNSYEVYAAGEEVSSTTVTYAYDGEDFTINDAEEEEDIIHVAVTDGLITDVYTRDIEEDDCVKCRETRVLATDLTEFEHILHFEYTSNGQLEFVSLPNDEVTDAIRMTYDTQGNPIEFEVNPFKIQDISDEETLAFLGLSFQYSEYDADLGTVVQKYAHPDEYITMLSVDYNYGLKNFLNHTFTAMNPLLRVFDNEHAIEQIGWAGHGSALLSEYTAFNDGGYPTEIKTYIQVSASDFPIEESDLELEYGIPLNGSVAVTYKLEYIEKQ